MSFTFYTFLIIVALLLTVFVWSLRSTNKQTVPFSSSGVLHDFQASHVMHLPQIRRALAPTDYEFVSKKISPKALRQMRRERRQVALTYLSALRAEFDRLMRTARVMAALSPEVTTGQEMQRIFLTVSFLWRYRATRLILRAGFAPLPQLSDLSNVLSSFSVRLEEAMREMGERAAVVADVVSSPDRRRIHPV
ncbi:MAG: hypothetical protein DMG37_11640 [Acidobacteria bacterium]|nr:MAG: hypothetical protein DMG37_11640 [Acidobacteriota bacterium]